MPSRPASSAAIAIRKPWPSAPISRSASTRTSSNRTLLVGEARKPIFRSRTPALTPGAECICCPATRAGGDQHEIRDRAVGDPGLVTADDVLVGTTVRRAADGLGAHRPGIGTGVRFRQAVGTQK